MSASGSFLFRPNDEERGFSPELFDSDARLMAQSVERFMQETVLPEQARLDAKETGLMRSLLEQAAALGLLGAATPVEYGGLGLPKTTELLLAEAMATEPSFAVSQGVHTGVGQLPLVFFGAQEQKQRYLPRLASGEWIGAYALTEASSGSDALAAKARADRSEDGKQYRMSGTKMWITNAGFADLFTVFAQADGAQFSAFLVERSTPNLAVGAEERKMGLAGSSTRSLILDDVAIGREQLLGQEGQGAKVALYCLNLGRLKIAASALGAAKELLGIAVKYAKQRVQFGRQICEFGLIRRKLGDVAARLYVVESAVYRTAGYLDDAFEKCSPDDSAALQKAAAGHAIECAICKVAATEALDLAVDEAVQIHGGYGFSEEYPVARHYRDARVTRIYEGTNEINRLNIAELTLKRMTSGQIMRRDGQRAATPGDFAREAAVSAANQALTMGAVDIAQEALGCLADLFIGSYLCGSAVARARSIGCAEANLAMSVFLNDAAIGAQTSLREIAGMLGLSELGPRWDNASNAFSQRSHLAEAVIEREGYPF